MTNKELEQRINKLEQELAELKKVKIEENKKWKPKSYEVYYFLDSYGAVENNTWEDDEYDIYVYLQGNCFQTEEEAEHYKRKLEVKAIYKNYILENSEPLDWRNTDQEKYLSSLYNGETEICFCVDVKHQGIIYASSREIIQQALNLIPKEDRYMLFEE